MPRKTIEKRSASFDVRVEIAGAERGVSHAENLLNDCLDLLSKTDPYRRVETDG